MSKSVKSCLKLCEEMLARDYRPEVKQVVSDYKDFFKMHQALLDVISLDPGNIKGMFWKFQEKVVKDFIEKDDREIGAGNFKPILVKALIPGKVFEGLSILEEGVRGAIEEKKIYYYSLSFFIPWERIQRWIKPVRYKVVDTVRDAEILEVKSIEARKKRWLRANQKRKHLSSRQSKEILYSSMRKLKKRGTLL
jgi:hypothetical protein